MLWQHYSTATTTESLSSSSPEATRLVASEDTGGPVGATVAEDAELATQESESQTRSGATLPAEWQKSWPLPLPPFATRWGRSMIGLAEFSDREGYDPSLFLLLGYCEYQLLPSGRFRYYGVVGNEPFITGGSYTIGSDTVSLVHDTVIEGRYPDEILRFLGEQRAPITRHANTGTRTFTLGIATYIEDFWWDGKGYRDGAGDRYHSASPQVTSSLQLDYRERCEYQLADLRRQLSMQSSFPSSLTGLAGSIDCPETKRRYSYDSATGTVRCPSHDF